MKRTKRILLVVIILFCIFKINKFFQYSLYSQSGCNYPPKFINKDHILTGGFNGIFYINVKDQTLMRYVRMPYKSAFCFDILDDKDIIFIFDDDIYTYDYETDKQYKNENVNIKDIFKEYQSPVFSSCIAYSKKYNVNWGFVRDYDKNESLYLCNTEYTEDMENDNWILLKNIF